MSRTEHGPAPSSGDGRRNLILITRRGAHDPADFGKIAERVCALDPSIKIFIVSPRDNADFLSPRDWQYPTLTVTMTTLGKFVPKRGRVLFNRYVSKFRQYELLVEMGVPTPRTVRYRSGIHFDPSEWGQFVVLKSDDRRLSSRGTTALLARTADLNRPERLSAGLRDKLSQPDMLVQAFIPTGRHATSYRAGTFLGEVIHMMRKSSSAAMPDLARDGLDDAIIDSNYETPASRTFAGRELVCDEAMMTLARRVAAGFPGLPLLGIDLLRNCDTEEVYVLEINGGGNTWQFSSKQAAAGREVISKEERVRQFDAWNTCAKALLAKTRELAT